MVSWDGQTKLYELKVINFCPSRYGRMQRAAPEQSGAVNFRAAAVAGEYRRRAQNVDRREAGTSETQIGPVESALSDYGGCTGLSLGHYGEASATVEEFLKWCAAVAAENSWRRLGFTYVTQVRHRGVPEHLPAPGWPSARAAQVAAPAPQPAARGGRARQRALAHGGASGGARGRGTQLQGRQATGVPTAATGRRASARRVALSEQGRAHACP